MFVAIQFWMLEQTFAVNVKTIDQDLYIPRSLLASCFPSTIMSSGKDSARATDSTHLTRPPNPGRSAVGMAILVLFAAIEPEKKEPTVPIQKRPDDMAAATYQAYVEFWEAGQTQEMWVVNLNERISRSREAVLDESEVLISIREEAIRWAERGLFIGGTTEEKVKHLKDGTELMKDYTHEIKRRFHQLGELKKKSQFGWASYD